MSMRRLAIAGRASLARPLRPPSTATRAHSQRLFTQNSFRLLISGRSPRPNLGFLAQPSVNGPQVTRLISTATGQAVRAGAIYYGKVVALALFVSFATLLMRIGWTMEANERLKPTPEEWWMMTREKLRGARAAVRVGSEGTGVVNWGAVAQMARKCLDRLEDERYDGQGLKQAVADENALIPNEALPPWDLTGQSYQWRSGYFEVCMLCATAAEHLDELVMDVTRMTIFPKACIVGPSNPDPRPVPPRLDAAPPLEKNCLPAFPAPEEFYVRVLTGVGFTTKQQLEAANAYATWLEFKGDKQKAEQAYKWALDLTRKAMSSPSDRVADQATAVLKETPDGGASENLLRATSSLATFYARIGDVSSALPILLSVLRARRSAPIDPAKHDRVVELNEATQPKVPRLTAIWNYLKPPRFPPPPPTGDDAFKRAFEQPDCEDGELMIYIGEILFAAGNQAHEGLAWTRQGVTIADSCLKAFNAGGDPLPQSFSELFLPDPTPKRKNAAAEKCKDCMFAGVQNWETMLQHRIAEGALEDATPREASRWSRWFGKPPDAVSERAGLEEELAQVAALKDKIVREGIALELTKYKPQVGGTWMG